MSVISLSTDVTSVQRCVKEESTLLEVGIWIHSWRLTPAQVCTPLWRCMIRGRTLGHLFLPSLWRTSSLVCLSPTTPPSPPVWDTASTYWETSREPERNWCCATILDKVQCGMEYFMAHILSVKISHYSFLVIQTSGVNFSPHSPDRAPTSPVFTSWEHPIVSWLWLVVTILKPW